jgi:tRNA(fMet)-specific endonuclease VapC
LALTLADTDVLIDYLQGVQPGAGWIAAAFVSESLAITAITAYELLSGAGQNKRGERTRRVVEMLPVLPIDRESAECAARLRQDLEREGVGIGMADTLIAGLALTHALPLMSRNAKHFSRVPGLQLLRLPPDSGPSIL